MHPGDQPLERRVQLCLQHGGRHLKHVLLFPSTLASFKVLQQMLAWWSVGERKYSCQTYLILIDKYSVQVISGHLVYKDIM